MEQPFKRRRVSLRVEQKFKETNAYGLRPKWNNYNLEKETIRGREQPLLKGTPSSASDGTNLPLNPFEPPHKAPYPGNEIHPILHPRNLTQRQSLVSPMSTAIVSVVQVDNPSGDPVVTDLPVPSASSAVSLPGFAPLTLSINPAVPSPPPVPSSMRAALSAVRPQSTQTSAAYSRAVPTSTPSASSTQSVSSSPSASASQATKSQDYAATSVTSDTATTSTPMTLNLQRLSSQNVLSPAPSSPLPPSPASSQSPSSESGSFFPSSAGTQSQSSTTQTPSPRESQPAPNSSNLSKTRSGNLSLSALLSANARPTLTGSSTFSTGSSSSSSKQTSTNSQSSRTRSGTSSTPSSTTTASITSKTSSASRTSASSTRSKSSFSSSSRRTSTSASTSSRSTSKPSSFITSTISQQSQTLASSPTITSGGATGGAGGYGSAGGPGNGASASSTATATAGAGAGAGSGGGGLTPATRAVVGGVVGGLAGLSIIFLLLLLLIRWRRNKALLQRPSFSPLPQTVPPGEAGQGSSMTDRSSAVPLAAGGFFKRLRPHSGQTAATSDTGQSERGFQNFGGRKLESVLSSRGDGYGEPGPSSITGPAAAFGSTPSVARGQHFGHSPGPSEPETLSGSSFYRDSQGFYGGKEADSGSSPSSLIVGPGSPPRSSPAYSPPPAGGLPPEGVAGPSRATSEIAVMRPGPARTPVTNQPGFIPMRSPPRPPRSTPSPRPPGGTSSPRPGPVAASPVPRPPDELGRSHPSFDGSRGSRFTEEV